MIQLKTRGLVIFHITHMRNLPSILEHNGLMSDSSAIKSGTEYLKIGYDDIKKRRIEKSIPCFDNINVGDCVPFYFGVRMPMLFVITCKNKELAYKGPAREIIYLVADLKSIIRSGLTWCYTDSNAACKTAGFYNRQDGFEKLDWAAIEEDEWGDFYNPNDPNLKERKQAEFLVYPFCPLDHIKWIVVHDEAVIGQLQNLLPAKDLQRFRIEVREDWYYD